MSPFIDASNEDLGGEQLAHGGLYSIGPCIFRWASTYGGKEGAIRCKRGWYTCL